MELRPWRWFQDSEPELTLVQALDRVKLNWQLNRSNLGLTDASPTVRPLAVSNKSMITRIRQSVLGFFSSLSRAGFEDPEWDFGMIDRHVKGEALLRRAIEKYVEQILKNGFDFTGKNPTTVKYIRKRFQQIRQVSGTTTLQLMQKIAYSLVAYQNVIIVKKRSERASGGRIRQTFDGTELKPIAAYFVVSPATVTVDKDEFGVVKRWKQKPLTTRLVAKNMPQWLPQNVIFFSDRSATDSQYFFAMPMALPVLPDIKALRETEELTMLQAIKFSIPRYHAKVGDKDRPAIQEELDTNANYLDTVPADSVIVTSSRVDIGSISSNDQVMELQPYLNYWWQRILSGLGMSKVGMGDGSTANRATAQTMTSEMQNTTIKFQQIIKDAFENYIIRELLFECGYTEETLDDDSMVLLHFPEIDLENKVKKENHLLALFHGNAITISELRNGLGRDTLSPADLKELYDNMFKSDPTNASAVTNKDQPANQHGSQKAKPRITKD